MGIGWGLTSNTATVAPTRLQGAIFKIFPLDKCGLNEGTANMHYTKICIDASQKAVCSVSETRTTRLSSTRCHCLFSRAFFPGRQWRTDFPTGTAKGILSTGWTGQLRRWLVGLHPQPTKHTVRYLENMFSEGFN